jgi:(2R)-ethylmalonyl-CoA mutase
VIGLSILSGSHVPLVREVMARLRVEGLGHIPVVVGGIVPPDDELVLKNIGVTAVYTPKDYVIDTIMADIVRIVGRSLDTPRPEGAKPVAAPARRAAKR